MIKILQRKPTDCGVACLAMLANVQYELAEQAFIESGLHLHRAKNRIKPYSSNFRDLTSAAEKLGRRLVRKKFISWDRIQNAAIIKVHKQKSGNWHWVVAVRRERGIEILDPGIDIPSYEIQPQNCEMILFSHYKPDGNILLIE